MVALWTVCHTLQYMSNKHFTDKRTLKDKRKCPYTVRRGSLVCAGVMCNIMGSANRGRQ